MKNICIYVQMASSATTVAGEVVPGDGTFGPHEDDRDCECGCGSEYDDDVDTESVDSSDPELREIMIAMGISASLFPTEAERAEVAWFERTMETYDPDSEEAPRDYDSDDD